MARNNRKLTQSRFVGLRTTPEEQVALLMAAEKLNCTVSTVVRACIHAVVMESDIGTAAVKFVEDARRATRREKVQP